MAIWDYTLTLVKNVLSAVYLQGSGVWGRNVNILVENSIESLHCKYRHLAGIVLSGF